MTLKVIGWVCWGIAVISIYCGAKQNKPLPLMIAAIALAANFVCLSYPF